MAEAQETKVGGSGEAWNTTEFLDGFRRIMERMTDDDRRRFNDELRQMEEQKMGLYAFLKENSDDTINENRKRTNELREQTEECNRDRERLNENEESKLN